MHTVVFPSNSIGFALGGAGTIVKSENSGSSWRRQAAPTDATWRGVTFPPGCTTPGCAPGWAVGGDGAIIRYDFTEQPTQHPTAAPTQHPTAAPTNNATGGTSLGVGVLVGISVGACSVVSVVAIGVWCWIRKKQRGAGGQAPPKDTDGDEDIESKSPDQGQVLDAPSAPPSTDDALSKNLPFTSTSKPQTKDYVVSINPTFIPTSTNSTNQATVPRMHNACTAPTMAPTSLADEPPPRSHPRAPPSRPKVMPPPPMPPPTTTTPVTTRTMSSTLQLL